MVKKIILQRALDLYIKEEAQALSKEQNPHRQLEHVNRMEIARDLKTEVRFEPSR